MYVRLRRRRKGGPATVELARNARGPSGQRRQEVLARLGRLDELLETGALSKLVRSISRLLPDDSPAGAPVPPDGTQTGGPGHRVDISSLPPGTVPESTASWNRGLAPDEPLGGVHLTALELPATLPDEMARRYLAQVRYGTAAAQALEALSEMVAAGDPYGRADADLLLRETALHVETTIQALNALVGTVGESWDAWRRLVEDLRARLSGSTAADARATFTAQQATALLCRRLTSALSHLVDQAQAAGNASENDLLAAFEATRASPPEDLDPLVLAQLRLSDVRRLAEVPAGQAAAEVTARVLGRQCEAVERDCGAIRDLPPGARWTDLDWGPA